MNKPMNILVTINSKYFPPLLVMLKSLFETSPGESFRVHLLYSDVKEEELGFLDRFCGEHGSTFAPIPVKEEAFSKAPINFHFSKEMYYRLLVSEMLPKDLDRVLYADPDIIVNNPVRPLYDMDLGKALFAMAGGVNETMELMWKTRIGMPLDQKYLNTGVILFNLEQLRKDFRVEEMFRFVEENADKLLWPDQDVINMMYRDRAIVLDPLKYNYDTRSHALKMFKPGAKTFMQNEVVFVHYMGPMKPWKSGYIGLLKDLFDKYANMVDLPFGIVFPMKD